jgi:hypothetical protein
MRVDSYNPATGGLLAEGITGIYFGNVRAGQHSTPLVLIKPVKTVETSISAMKLFLQADGGLTASQFGYLVLSAFDADIVTADLVNHFVVAPDAVDVGYVGGPGEEGAVIPVASGSPTGWVWLDIQPGAFEVGSTSTINYRFVFDYT